MLPGSAQLQAAASRRVGRNTAAIGQYPESYTAPYTPDSRTPAGNIAKHPLPFDKRGLGKGSARPAWARNLNQSLRASADGKRLPMEMPQLLVRLAAVENLDNILPIIA